MLPQPATTDMPGLYAEDFFEWTRRNARLLRAGQLHKTDIRHVAKEIEDLGKQDLKELNRRARAVLAHLLICRLPPGKQPKSSLRSITIERIELRGLLKQSPSLKSKLANGLRNTHVMAVRRAMAKTAAKRTVPRRMPVYRRADPRFGLLANGARKRPDAVSTCKERGGAIGLLRPRFLRMDPAERGTVAGGPI